MKLSSVGIQELLRKSKPTVHLSEEMQIKRYWQMRPEFIKELDRLIKEHRP